MSMNEPGGYGRGGGGGGYDVPPVEAGELGVLDGGAKWPTVLGWFSIVLGGLGILKNGCGAISNLLMGGGLGMAGMFGGGGSEQQKQIEQAMASMGPWIMVVGVLGLVSFGVSVLLLVAGIQMVRRRRASVGMHRTWSWVRIGMVVIETGAGMVVQMAVMNAMMSSMPQGGGAAGGPPPGFGQMMMAFTVVGVCFAVLLGLAYPVVVLIVLGKRWAKEEVARWEGGSAVKMEW